MKAEEKSKMEIEKFRKVHYYGSEGELTPEQVRQLGLKEDDYESLSERAYQCAYDLSNDWAKDVPGWDDVQTAFKLGVYEAEEYYRNVAWHIASEKPKDSSRVLLLSSDNSFLIMGRYLSCDNRVIDGVDMFYMYDSYKWAYLDDLLPSKLLRNPES